MKPKERAAMQAAWVWMDWYSSNNGTLEPVDFNETITVLQEALEQPDEIDWIETNKALANEIIELQKQAEQEPVAWRVRGYNQFKTGNPAPWRYVDGADKPTVNKPDCCDFEPLYAASVRTKDLTDDEAQKLWNDTSSIVPMWAHHLHFARAVIAADREKNK